MQLESKSKSKSKRKSGKVEKFRVHSIASHFSEGHLFDKAAPAYKELGGSIRGRKVQSERG